MYNVGLDDGLSGQDIYSIAQDQEGRIWVSTDNGISICWLEEGKKRIKNIGRPEGLPDDIIRYLLPDAAGRCNGYRLYGWCASKETMATLF